MRIKRVAFILTGLIATIGVVNANNISLDTDDVSGVIIGASVGAFIPSNSMPDNEFAANGIVGYQFNDMWSMQLAGSVGPNLNSVRAEGIFTIPISQYFRPYIAATAGSYYQDATMFAYGAGAGAYIGLTRQLDLTIDYRYIRGVYANTPSTNMATVGIRWRFANDTDKALPYIKEIQNKQAEINYLQAENSSLEQYAGAKKLKPIQYPDQPQQPKPMPVAPEGKVVYSNLSEPTDQRQYYIAE